MNAPKYVGRDLLQLLVHLCSLLSRVSPQVCSKMQSRTQLQLAPIYVSAHQFQNGHAKLLITSDD